MQGSLFFVVGCPCGFWCCGLTTCSKYVCPGFGNHILHKLVCNFDWLDDSLDLLRIYIYYWYILTHKFNLLAHLLCTSNSHIKAIHIVLNLYSRDLFNKYNDRDENQDSRSKIPYGYGKLCTSQHYICWIEDSFTPVTHGSITNTASSLAVTEPCGTMATGRLMQPLVIVTLLAIGKTVANGRSI